MNDQTTFGVNGKNGLNQSANTLSNELEGGDRFSDICKWWLHTILNQIEWFIASDLISIGNVFPPLIWIFFLPIYLLVMIINIWCGFITIMCDRLMFTCVHKSQLKMTMTMIRGYVYNNNNIYIYHYSVSDGNPHILTLERATNIRCKIKKRKSCPIKSLSGHHCDDIFTCQLKQEKKSKRLPREECGGTHGISCLRLMDRNKISSN